MDTSKKRKRDRKVEHDAGHPLYPRCDGEPWQRNGANDLRTKVQRRFLDAYFRINLAYAKLVALRGRWRSRPPRVAEHKLLRKIEEALVAREVLAERHACRGVVAIPVYRDGFTVDVRFSDAQTGQERGHWLVASSSSVRLTFGLPVELRRKMCKS
jgi:hypothetical protein